MEYFYLSELRHDSLFHSVPSPLFLISSRISFHSYIGTIFCSLHCASNVETSHGNNNAKCGISDYNIKMIIVAPIYFLDRILK